MSRKVNGYEIVPKANLKEAELCGFNLREANLREANLNFANLSKTDLENADLSGSDLERANLRDSNLKNANLCKADLSGANLHKANLRGADLSKANLNNTNLTGANLEGTKIDNTNFENANLTNTKLLIEFYNPSMYRSTIDGVKTLDNLFGGQGNILCSITDEEWIDIQTKRRNKEQNEIVNIEVPQAIYTYIQKMLDSSHNLSLQIVAKDQHDRKVSYDTDESMTTLEGHQFAVQSWLKQYGKGMNQSWIGAQISEDSYVWVPLGSTLSVEMENE